MPIFSITETRPETHCRCRRPECQPAAKQATADLGISRTNAEKHARTD